MAAGNVKQATDNTNARIKGEDIARRLLNFGVRVLRLVRLLPRDYIGRHVGRQLLRAATAGGANYEESCSAESRADFAHKVSIAAKELRESRYWLRLIDESGLLGRRDLTQIVREAGELVAILTASAKTAKAASR